MNLKGVFSHKSDDWCTPEFIYSYFMHRGYFDPCLLNPNGIDGLFIQWKEKNFVNPPYSDILRFVEKALFEADLGKKVVMLLPVRTDTKWFGLLSNYGCFIEFFVGRLKFNGSKTGAPFPSMLVWLEKGGNKYFQISPKVYG